MVWRDWLWFGTAYSAPPYLLVPHAWALVRLLRGPGDLEDYAREVPPLAGDLKFCKRFR